MNDEYLTIARSASAEIKIKGSRFIGECACAESPDSAQEILTAIRKREHAATHHCWAWKVGLFEKTSFKYSDDGEPNGSAGKPIYDVLCGSGVTNAIVVVTRYYGGTKLGTGGLVRAYGEAAGLALQKAGRQENFLKERFTIEIEFSHYDQLNRLLQKYQVWPVSNEFSDLVKITLDIRKNHVEKLTEAVIELSGGKANIEKIEAV
jgi:uncharacterized YigZ family protein